MVIVAAITELLMAVLLTLVGFFQWSGAEAFCQERSERRERASKIVRFLFYPAWFYEGRRCMWHVRLGAAAAMLGGLVLIAAAVMTLVSGRTPTI
jgi:hypothetical protein